MSGGSKRYDYLFVPDIQAFRRKMKNLTGAAALLWKNIRTINGEGAERRFTPVECPAFSYLATGDDDYAREALKRLKRAMEVYLAGDVTADVQFHVWCNAAPLARLATMLDWIADSRAVPRADYEQIKEAMLDYTLKHPFTRAKARVLTADNQIAAMSFCCALVGYLFGVQRGKDLRAQRLLAAGAMRFPDIIGLSPKGGYSYEGSTYFCQVVSPVVTWYNALMEQITGQELFFKPMAPNYGTVGDILRTYLKIIGPSGLVPPWDNYGWSRCSSTMGLAYLAGKTGDPAALKVMERLNLCAEPNSIAWGSDDKIWTLLWWPDNVPVKSTEDAFQSWAIENVAGALVDDRKAWRLFQAWDRCGEGVNCGRCQVNPNMISLDLWGSPIFTDGTPKHETCTVFNYPIETFYDRFKEGELDAIMHHWRTFRPDIPVNEWVKWFSYGLIGASNSVIVNGEGDYSPREPKEGKLVAMAALPNFKLLASEAGNFYRPRYPIESMVRTSVLVRDDYFLVSDGIRTAGPALRYDWQVFSRGHVTASGRNVNIVTPEEVEVDIIPLGEQAPPQLADVPGFPRGPENASTLIRYGLQGANVEMPFLIVPHRRIRAVGNLEKDGWSSVRMGKDEGIAAGLPNGVKARKTGPAATCGLLPSSDGRDGWVWAGRTFRLPAACKGKRTLLFFASLVHDLNVWVNGQPAAFQAMPQKGDPVDYVPAVVDVTAAVRNGLNSLVIAGKTTQGKLVNGAVEIAIDAPKPALPVVRTLSPGHHEISGEFGRDVLMLNPAGLPIRAEGIQGSARAVLMSGKSFAALQATRLAFGDVQFWSDRPIDVACQDGQVTLGDLSEHHLVELITPDFHLRLQSRGVLEIDLAGRKRPRIVSRLAGETRVFCNGNLTPARWDSFSGRLVVEGASSVVATPSDKAMPKYVQRMEDLMRRASKGDAASMRRLIAALDDKDWKVQMVAAELLGRVGGQEAVGPLLNVVERETPEAIYGGPLPMGWAEAIDKYDDEGPAPFLAGSGSSGDLVKRHRLKVVAVEALGLLRAKEAVPALCRIIEDQREFYPVHSVACQALGRIGDAAALPALKKAADYPEINTKYRARDAIHRLTNGSPAHAEYPGRHD